MDMPHNGLQERNEAPNPNRYSADITNNSERSRNAARRRCDHGGRIHPRSMKILVRSSTFDSGIQNQWWNSPKQSLLESSCVISRIGPGRVKYLYQHDFFTFSNHVLRFFWHLRSLRSTENSHETLLYLNARELMDPKLNASPKVKSTPKSASKNLPKSVLSWNPEIKSKEWLTPCCWRLPTMLTEGGLFYFKDGGDGGMGGGYVGREVISHSIKSKICTSILGVEGSKYTNWRQFGAKVSVASSECPNTQVPMFGV